MGFNNILRRGYRAFLGPAILSLLGIVFAAISSPLGIGKVALADERQVGYLLAPNWVGNSILLFPIFGIVTLLLLRQIEVAVRQATQAGMFWDSQTRRCIVDANTPLKRWRTFFQAGRWIWLVLAILAVGISAYEGYRDSYRPVTEKWSIAQLAAHDIDQDWAVANLVDQRGDVTATENWVFTLAVFLLLQAPELILVALFLVVVVSLAAFVVSFCQGRVRLIPSLRTADPRLGFEHFAGLGNLILVASFLLYFAMFLTTLQNDFLRPTSSELPQAKSLYSKLLTPMVEMIQAAEGSRLEVAKGYLQPNKQTDFSTTWATYGGLIVIVLIVITIPGLIFWFAAYQARIYLRGQVLSLGAKPIRAAFDLSLPRAEAAITSMRIWPYRYFSFNVLLVTAVILSAVMFWPELAIYFYVVLLLTAIGIATTRLGQVFRRESGEG